MSENLTETEQLYGLTADETEEVETQTDEVEQSKEEIHTEEELEIEREIESYQSKIAKLDEQLAGFKSESIAESKRKAMREARYNEEQIERYLRHVEGETADEIKASVFNLVLEIPPTTHYVDPSLGNTLRSKPKVKDPSELGKKVFERIKHKIWGRGATL